MIDDCDREIRTHNLVRGADKGRSQGGTGPDGRLPHVRVDRLVDYLSCLSVPSQQATSGQALLLPYCTDRYLV